MSAFAIWLDTVFAAFDGAILNFWHDVATTDCGRSFFTAFMQVIRALYPQQLLITDVDIDFSGSWIDMTK